MPKINARRLAGLLVSTCAALSGPALAKDMVIHAGSLIDGLNKTPRTQVSILIHNDRITSVEPGYLTQIGERRVGKECRL